MTPFDDYTWHEIQSQPQAWTETLRMLGSCASELAGFLQASGAEQAIFTGCGSTYYLSLSAAAAMREIGRFSASAAPASELWLDPSASFADNRRSLLIAVSRSGETSETLQAVEAFRTANRGPILTISCYAERPLARMGDYNLIVAAGQERSIAQTRAFSTLYLATLAVALLQGGQSAQLAALDTLPRACERLLTETSALAQQLADDTTLDRCFFLGSGSRYGLACELSLKMKEMSLSVSEPFHFLEFRHGPQSMAGPGALIIGLLSHERRLYELAVLDEMRRLGATIIAIGAAPAEITIDIDLADALRGALYLPFGQTLAYRRAIRRGLTPDHPHQLQAVVRLPTSP